MELDNCQKLASVRDALRPYIPMFGDAAMFLKLQDFSSDNIHVYCCELTI